MRIVPALAMLLAACSKSDDVLEELPNSSIAGAPRQGMSESRMDAAQKRAVTIGEDGPRLDACGAMGQASRVGAKGLAVRAAPFADAAEVGRMAEGERAHVCTRSLDQRWLGVVIPPRAAQRDIGSVGTMSDRAAPVDCGVSDPVERKQPYGGPCLSGWVSSAAIRLVAG